MLIVFIEVDAWCDDVDDDNVLCMAFGMYYIRFIQITTDLFAAQIPVWDFVACDDVIVVIVVIVCWVFVSSVDALLIEMNERRKWKWKTQRMD